MEGGGDHGAGWRMAGGSWRNVVVYVVSVGPIRAVVYQNESIKWRVECL